MKRKRNEEVSGVDERERKRRAVVREIQINYPGMNRKNSFKIDETLGAVLFFCPKFNKVLTYENGDISLFLIHEGFDEFNLYEEKNIKLLRHYSIKKKDSPVVCIDVYKGYLEIIYFSGERFQLGFGLTWEEFFGFPEKRRNNNNVMGEGDDDKMDIDDW